jgi:predicted ATPase
MAAYRQQNLPTPLTALIGHEHEMAEISALLRRSDIRLVTLTGSGGTGKTRLAIQVIADLSNSFSDGVFFVDLAPINHPLLISGAIAQVLGIQADSGQMLIQNLNLSPLAKHSVNDSKECNEAFLTLAILKKAFSIYQSRSRGGGG